MLSFECDIISEKTLIQGSKGIKCRKKGFGNFLKNHSLQRGKMHHLILYPWKILIGIKCQKYGFLLLFSETINYKFLIFDWFWKAIGSTLFSTLFSTISISFYSVFQGLLYTLSYFKSIQIIIAQSNFITNHKWYKDAFGCTITSASHVTENNAGYLVRVWVWFFPDLVFLLTSLQM